MIDYHVHTNLCNHASGTMEDYVLAAIGAGLDEICFTDHLTLCRWGRNNAMDTREIPLYRQSVCRLKHKYADKIAVKSGLEIDFDEDWVDFYQALIQFYDFDAVIASVHFIDGLNVASRQCATDLQKVDQETICNHYFDKLETMLGFDFFDIVGHLDIIKKTDVVSIQDYQDRLDRVLETIAANKLTLEFNASGFAYPCRDSFPSISLAGRCYNAGIGVTIGSDAHHPAQVGRFADDLMDGLWQVGYRFVNTFSEQQSVPKKMRQR